HSTGRPAFIAFTGSFHGRTYGALSLTSSKVVQRVGFGPFLPEVYHVPYAYRYRCDFCAAAPECAHRCWTHIEDDLFARRLDPKSVAAIVVEPILVEREFMANARVMGERLLSGVQRLAEQHVVIGEVRGRGLMIGLEFVKDRRTREPHAELAGKLEHLAFSKGLLILGAGKNCLRLAPPLVVDEYDVDTAVSILDRCLTELAD